MPGHPCCLENHSIVPDIEELDSYLFYLAARAAIGVFRLIPRPLGRLLLNALATLVFWLDAQHRHIALVNLRIAFPSLGRTERRRIALASFRSTAQNLLEVSRLTSLTPGNISSLVEYDREKGLDNYLAARALGRPILYLTGHFSAWELLPVAHALYGHPLCFVTRPLDNRLLERYLKRIRQHCGNVVISKTSAAREILATLRNNGSVGLLLDHNTNLSEGTFAEFFGLPAATSTSLARFALRTDAVVVTGYLAPAPRGRYRMKFLPPLDLVRSGDMARDLIENTRLINRVLEAIVREQPESWLWGHMRWKLQPSGPSGELYRLTPAELEGRLAAAGRAGVGEERSG